MIGKTIAHYEIVELLGEGGMGQVYRARDSKLGRDVALKILPQNLTDDAERVARFRREARTLASLQHPNIAAIHGLDEADGHLFLTMELVEGEDLSQRLARGPIPVDEALEIAICIAQGLEAAHANDLVHRDLKPANVKLAPDGTAKVLDFGLARAIAGQSVEESDIGTSPTITAAMTQAGTILGTASYMSPEQARGRPVDHRADIWAFGVVLWEMLNGKRLFQGDTTTDVLANVLKQPIDPRDVPRGTPSNVRRVLERCITRDPKQRLHAIADARIELQAEEAVAKTPKSSGAPWQWILSGAFALATLVALWGPWRQAPIADDPSRVLSMNLPKTLPLSLIDWSAVAVSPDGKRVAVTSRVDEGNAIIVRDLRTGDLRVILDEGRAYNVFFSPDSRWIGYTTGSHFVKANVEGGSPVDIVATAHPRGASWGDQGHLYFSPGYTAGIHRVLDTGNAVPETLTVVREERGERTHRWPHVLPGERGVLFTVGTSTSPGDYEDAEIWVLDLETGQSKDTGLRGALAKYVSTGHALLARQGTLHAVPFDLETLETQGSPVPVYDGIRGDPASGMYYFDLDDAGNLFYVAGDDRGPRRRLQWVDRDGAMVPLDLEPGSYRYPRLDMEGNRVVLVLGEGHGNNDDVHLLDLDELNPVPLTFDGANIMPTWSPDHGSIIYSSIKENVIKVRDLGPGATIRTIPTDDSILINNDLGADGRTLLTTRLDSKSPGDLVVIDLETGETQNLLDTDAVEWAASFAPDMKWFAYVSDETGREEVFIQPYPTTSAGSKWQVSQQGGRSPRWSDDGSEIFFVSSDAMWSVRVEVESRVRVRSPEKLFDLRMDDSGVPIANYDVTPDGQRFLVVTNDRSTDTHSVEVVLGWIRVLDETRF